MILLSDFRKAKIKREFKLLDVNQDNHLGKVDFMLAGQALISAMGWDPDGPASHKLLKKQRLVWEEICLAADFDQSGVVDFHEYLEFYERMTASMGSDPAAAPNWFRRVCAAHVESMDIEGKGQVTFEDYQRFIKAHHHDGFDLEASFKHLDLDNNGHIDTHESVLLCLQFYLGEDRSMPGNWLFGPVEAAQT